MTETLTDKPVVLIFGRKDPALASDFHLAIPALTFMTIWMIVNAEDMAMTTKAARSAPLA